MSHGGRRVRFAIAAGACLAIAAMGAMVIQRAAGKSGASEQPSGAVAIATGRESGPANSGTGIGSSSPAATSGSDDAISKMAPGLLALTRPADSQAEDTAGDPDETDIVLIVDNDADANGPILDWQKVAAGEMLADLHRSTIAIVTTADPSGFTASLAPSDAALSRSLSGLKAAGKRDLVAAVRRAASILAARTDRSRHGLIILMAAGSGDATSAGLAAAGGVASGAAGAGVSSSAGAQAGLTLARLAIGRGSHEQVLFNSGPSTGFAAYQFAPLPSDIPTALDALRMQAERSELVFETTTSRWPAGGPWSRAVAINDGLTSIRACATTMSPIVQLALIDPSGNRIDGKTTAGAASVSQEAGRTCLAVKSPAGGNWSVQVEGDAAARAWPLRADVEAIPPDSGRSSFIVRQLGDASWPLAVTATYADKITSDGTVWSGLNAPNDECWRADFAAVGPSSSPAETNVDGCRDESELDAEVPTTITPGSYRIEISVTFSLAGWDKDPSTAPAKEIAREAVISTYEPVSIDSDGDGLSDNYETTFGMNPHDPADGLGDPDHDGLSTTVELTVTGTNPMAKDTDGGGQSDGDEVAAGKNPFDSSDDVRAMSCMGSTNGAYPTTQSYPPGQTFPRDLALEDTLPTTILGRPTQRTSAIGEAGLQDYILSAMGKALELCLGKQDADVTTAFAFVPNDPDNWLVEALKIKGTTGSQLEQALLEVEPGTLDNNPPTIRTVAGKSYRIYNTGLAVYTTMDAIYLVYRVSGGDYAGPTPAHSPLDVNALFDDVVRQLP